MGLGKTVYFRLGMGLVVYYSRILNASGQYEHRLAVTLVENEKLSNTIIGEFENGVSSGIAWWGERVAPDSQETRPITDEVIIRDILQSLSIQPFEKECVGTKLLFHLLMNKSYLLNMRLI